MRTWEQSILKFDEKRSANDALAKKLQIKLQKTTWIL